MRVAWFVSMLLAGLFACGQPPRPTPLEWREKWLEASDLVRMGGDLTGVHARDACERLLASVRELEPDLLPSPHPGLDATVERWVHAAEELGYECPNAKQDADAFGAATQKLALLAAEIDAGLSAAEPPLGVGGAGASRP